MDDPSAMVLDKGGDSFRAGFAGNDAPCEVFPSSCVPPPTSELRPHTIRASMWEKKRSTRVGDDVEATELSGLFQTIRPIQRGIVVDWEAMEQLYEYTFSTRLRSSPRDHPILLSEPLLNPKQDKEKHIELLFETFGGMALQFADSGLLSLYSAGRGIGLVLSCGDGVSNVHPIYYGRSLKGAIRRSNIGGQDATEHLRRILSEQGVYLPTCHTDAVKQMKEKHCFVAESYKNSLAISSSSAEMKATYLLPDGQEVTLDSERFRCMEGLFQPSLWGMETLGIAEMVLESLSKCNIHLRKDLAKNIILSGATTLAPGFPERLRLELEWCLPGSCRVNVVTMPERRYLAWVGGSIMASLSSFQSNWFTKEHYDEYGAAGIHAHRFH